VIKAADGSALWKQDASSVLAAVYGPKQASMRKEDAERAVVEVIFKSTTGLSGGLSGGG
jgi:exosome complex component RRP46